MKMFSAKFKKKNYLTHI